jgi:signal transduction histidine kinase
MQYNRDVCNQEKHIMSPRAPLPYNEQERIAALHKLNILDTPPEERFERLVRLAKRLFHVPIVTISLVDTHRQWFKAYCGLAERETPREHSFCAYTLLDGAPLIVPDALEDPRFVDNPGVIDEPCIRFYAGYPLKDPKGYILGTLCIIDGVPRQFHSEELELLQDMAQIVEYEIQMTSMQRVLLSQLLEGQLQEKLMAALHVVLEATQAAVMFFSLDERVRILNRRFTEFFGLTSEQLQHSSIDQIRESILPFFAPETTPPDLFQRDLTNPGTAELFTQAVVQIAPVHRELNLQTYPVYLPSREYLGRLYIYVDITKEREAEQFKNEFVSLVSHELRTPLTSIKGFVGLMMEEESGPLNEEQHEYLSIIRENSERLIALVNDLLDISRIESGKVELQRKPVNLEQLCRNLAKSFEPLFVAKKQQLTLQFAEHMHIVLADEHRLQQIINNLLSNASKYTLEGGLIQLWTQREEDMIRIGVEDTGVGMTAEEQGALFTKFYRVKNRLTENVSGTGLGLTITRSLIELHGGKIQVESTPGEGSTFSFTLPLVPALSPIKALTSPSPREGTKI